jgi:hypothetical protein
MTNYPSVEQLLDLFNWASPGMVVTDGDGRVALVNKAATELLGTRSRAGAVLPELLGVNDYDALFSAGEPVENREVAFPNDEFPAGYANIGFGPVGDRRYGFWALRPSTSRPTPSAGSEAGTGSGQSWISRVQRASDYSPASPGDVDLIRGFYDHCPVAIHLIAEDGRVAHANWKDIEIVGASAEPDSYVGHHIRHIYADQAVIDDFLNRWGDDSPIIDFRAHFLNKGERVPVVIFSTANVSGGTLHNTRCFVFPDNAPQAARDRVAALDLSF